VAFSPSRDLRPNETILVCTRRHPVVLIVPITLLLVVFVMAFVMADWVPAGSGVAPWLVLCALIAAGVAIFVVIEWYVDRFVITDGRLLLFQGVLSHRVAMMPVLKVTDLTYERPGLGRLVGYCNLKIESAGQDQALHTVKHLPDPFYIYDVVMDIVDRPKEPAGRRRGPGDDD
jgi:uncharacterized membrane protein YdbT with pleckstrin-like domain